MRFCLSLLIAIFPVLANATLGAAYEESVYDYYKFRIATAGTKSVPQGLSITEQKLYIDALWDLWDEGQKSEAIAAIDSVDVSLQFSVVERLRLAILKLKAGTERSLDSSLITDIENALRLPEVDKRLVYIIAAHEELLLQSQATSIVELASRNDSYSDIRDAGENDGEILAEVVTDLYFNTPDITTYMEGEYIKSVKIFMFCHANRLYPCLMVMRDTNGTNVRNSDGTLWSNPALASARSGFPSYQRNGNTPAGIFTIDSVMPTADQQLSFGKFRRMILNFVPKSRSEALIKSLLPKSSHENDWWKPTTVARDAGRNLFRIHGSGRLNTEPNTPYYPLNRTNGCISQRENTYDGITYKDQRDLLDSIMKALELEPSYANEPKIKGILYIMELGDKNSQVTLEELAPYGIK